MYQPIPPRRSKPTADSIGATFIFEYTMDKLTAVPFALAIFASLAFSQTVEPTTMDHTKMDHAAHMKMMADPRRQAEVSERGGEVMPFSLAATTHFFAKSANGGFQQVIAKKSDDKAQVKLVRLHLQEIRAQFLEGDFSGPSHIHGEEMPGLSELKDAKSGQIEIVYREVTGGAELAYRTSDGSLVAALHKWFDAQLSDHASDAKVGNAYHEGK